MADALSQEQIDAMLNAAMSGGTIETVAEVEDEIKEYDFRSPKKFTRERLKILDNIFDGYGRLLSSYLTGLLRLYCQVSLVSIEEQRYYEFNNGLPDYVIMGLMTLQLNDEDVEDLTLIFQMANALTFIMIDRLLGGKGEYKDSDRDFTEIEVSIMHSIIGSMSKMLKEPWANYVDLEPKLRGIETNSRVVSAVGYDDTMMICIFEVLIGETKTMITICMPALQLDEIMQKYTQQTVRSSRRFNQEKEDLRLANIKSGVVNSALDVTAVLGEVSVDMFDIINLQVNDIIPLGKSIDSNVAIRIGGRLWFDGKLGTMNSNKAIRIEHVLRALNND